MCATIGPKSYYISKGTKTPFPGTIRAVKPKGVMSMTENQNFYTDALQAFDVPAAPQKETAMETEILPAPAPEKKRRPRWVKVLCGLLCAVLLAGIGLEVWLEHRPLPDTDPNAPFLDLSDRTKEKVKKAVTEYQQKIYPSDTPLVYWYSEPEAGLESLPKWEKLRYAIQYYGTVGGYIIVLSPHGRSDRGYAVLDVGNYSFRYSTGFFLLAYKNGSVVPVKDMYEQGFFTDEQIGLMHQCYERYKLEIYPYWEYSPPMHLD